MSYNVSIKLHSNAKLVAFADISIDIGSFGMNIKGISIFNNGDKLNVKLPGERTYVDNRGIKRKTNDYGFNSRTLNHIKYLIVVAYLEEENDLDEFVGEDVNKDKAIV